MTFSRSVYICCCSFPMGQDNTSCLSLCCCAAENLEGLLLLLLLRGCQGSVGFILRWSQLRLKAACPCPRILSQSKHAPGKNMLFVPVTVSGYRQYVDLEGADKVALVNPPPLELSLAACLAPSYNQSESGPSTVPSKQSTRHQEKNLSHSTTGRTLSSATMLKLCACSTWSSDVT
ncbi:hypothetical protein XENOCAPTIV_010398 [Xenoophorus captivus]|uniref:Uncharacterized protein n=1 Tax=Xenoophorus captivus TaxID=1517983 RepID=A0ABV0QZL6_9TELE